MGPDFREIFLKIYLMWVSRNDFFGGKQLLINVRKTRGFGAGLGKNKIAHR